MVAKIRNMLLALLVLLALPAIAYSAAETDSGTDANVSTTEVSQDEVALLSDTKGAEMRIAQLQRQLDLQITGGGLS